MKKNIFLIAFSLGLFMQLSFADNNIDVSSDDNIKSETVDKKKDWKKHGDRGNGEFKKRGKKGDRGKKDHREKKDEEKKQEFVESDENS